MKKFAAMLREDSMKLDMKHSQDSYSMAAMD
jgi:hypothetical protein